MVCKYRAIKSDVQEFFVYLILTIIRQYLKKC
jgi:hypothetical protein